MFDKRLTKDEAKVLQATTDSEGSFLYELAWAARLTPADVLKAAERLAARGFVVLDHGRRSVRMTPLGKEVRYDISRSSLDDPHLKLGRSYVIAAEAATDDTPYPYDAMSESEILAAIDAEISKYDGPRKETTQWNNW
jgi:hypothetical protein